MKTIFLAAMMLALGMQTVEKSADSTTQLYVKTVPPGAEVAIDGNVVGNSDKLFDVRAGAHKVVLSLSGYVMEERSVDVRDAEITRLEVELKKRSGKEVVLGYGADSSKDMRSFADSGHAVAFQRSADMKSIYAVKLYAGRYGYPQAPKEDFHIYLLDENKKVLEHIPVPYSKIERGRPHWQTIEFPAVEVPEKFIVALWFNAEATKGVYLGMDKGVTETHSYDGLPDKGFQRPEESYEWMIRAVVSPDEGKQPTHPKVKTYEDEKAEDTESTDAQPAEGSASSETSNMRTWSDSTGTFTLEAEFVGIVDGKVKLKKSDGKMAFIPLDRLSKEDQTYVTGQTEKKPQTATEPPAAKETRELSLDSGTMANKRSIAGGGHAVKFKVEGKSNYVTSVSLHGSRYGMPQPPREDFHVWICDSKFKPIATFKFRYGAYTRGNPVWKSFKVKPTRVPEEFIVCFGFNPQQTKGVYVSFDNKPSQTSMVGIPGRGEPQPFTDGNWMIRCKVEKRGDSAQSELSQPTVK
jgi:hypothetical protein